MVPANPIKAAADGDMIGLIVFSLIFGMGLALTRTPAALRLRRSSQGLYDVMMRLIDGVLKLAPIGVAALLFSMTAQLGFDVLRQLAPYVGVVLLALGLHMFVVYSLSVRFLGGRNPLQFFRDMRLAMITAFSTASSSATLPTALKVAEENLQLPRQRVALRPHRRRGDEPERHRALRGRHRPLPRAGLRRAAEPRAVRRSSCSSACWRASAPRACRRARSPSSR